MSYWKVLTSEYRPPIQGGDPLCDGKAWPVTLPEVPLDRSERECGSGGGWHFCRSIEAAFKIAGLWRTGRPNAVVLVEPHGDIIERADKMRASSLTLSRLATDDEVRDALLAFSVPFGAHQAVMAEEQWLWWQALGRPLRNRGTVVDGLTCALRARSLDWTVKEYPSEKAAWDAWGAWGAWGAWDAWDARGALAVQYAARSGWINHKHDALTIGIRDAYHNGLAIAIPTGPNELGFAI